MTTIAFDSLAFVNTVEAAGMERKQAEAIAKAIGGLRVEHNGVASREELVAHEKEIADLKHETAIIYKDIALIQKDIAEIKNSLATTMATKADVRESELRVKLQIGSMIFLLGGLLVGIKYFG